MFVKGYVGESMSIVGSVRRRWPVGEWKLLLCVRAREGARGERERERERQRERQRERKRERDSLCGHTVVLLPIMPCANPT